PPLPFLFDGIRSHRRNGEATEPNAYACLVNSIQKLHVWPLEFFRSGLGSIFPSHGCPLDSSVLFLHLILFSHSQMLTLIIVFSLPSSSWIIHSCCNPCSPSW
ncbi:unnamed protein product, partial [Musa hybrid cultivar]